MYADEWDNRESLKPLLVLEFRKNDLVRYRKYVHIEFWKRDNFTITNTIEGLEQFQNFQIDIDWLKDLRKELKEKIEK
jgi:hypothetical protein